MGLSIRGKDDLVDVNSLIKSKDESIDNGIVDVNSLIKKKETEQPQPSENIFTPITELFGKGAKNGTEETSQSKLTSTSKKPNGENLEGYIITPDSKLPQRYQQPSAPKQKAVSKPTTVFIDKNYGKPTGDIKTEFGIISNEDKQFREQQKGAYQQHLNEALNNTAVKILQQKGIDPNTNKLAYSQEVNALYKAHSNNDLGVTYDPKTGQYGFTQLEGSLDSFLTGIDNATRANDEADDFMHKMSNDERADYANKLLQGEKNSPYLGKRPNGSWSGITGFVGENLPFLAKAGTATIGTTAAIGLAPESMGASLEGLPAVMGVMATMKDMMNTGGKDEVIRGYQILKNENPNIPDAVLMKQAYESRANIGALTGGLTNIALGSEIGHVFKDGITQGAKGVLKNTLKNIGNTTLKLGTVGAAGSAANIIEGAAEGYKVSLPEATNQVINNFVEGAKTGGLLSLTMGAAHGLLTVPNILKSAIKYSIVESAPIDKIKEGLDANEKSGNIPQGTSQELVNDLTEYKQALDKVPSHLPDDVKASVAGLIQKREHLKQEQASKDESLKGGYDEQIKSVNDQINKIVNTGDVASNEINELSGETYKQSQPQPKEEISEGKITPIKIAGTEVVEHAEDVPSSQDLENGINPTDLTEKGKAEANNLGKHIFDNGKTEIISSDVDRAKKTAQIAADEANRLTKENLPINEGTPLAEASKIKTSSNPLLNTLDIGKYENEPTGSFPERHYFENPNEVIEGTDGKTAGQWMKQMEDAYKFVKDAPKEAQVIAHSKVIRAFKALEETNGKWTAQTTKKFLELGEKENEPRTATTEVGKTLPTEITEPKGQEIKTGIPTSTEPISEGNAEGGTAIPKELSSVEETAKALTDISDLSPITKIVHKDLSQSLQDVINSQVYKIPDKINRWGIKDKEGYTYSSKKEASKVVEDGYNRDLYSIELFRKKETPESISKKYHNAKADGSNPELVKAVEDLLGKPKQIGTTIPKELSSVEDVVKNISKVAPHLDKRQVQDFANTIEQQVIGFAKHFGISEDKARMMLTTSYTDKLSKDAGYFQPFEMKMLDGSNQQVRRLPEDLDVVNGFYSTIEKKILDTKQNNQSTTKWLQLFGKGDEAIYTGIKEHLESKRPDQQVTKQELLDYMKNNRVQIVEVMKGAIDYGAKNKNLSYTGDDDFIFLKDNGRNTGYEIRKKKAGFYDVYDNEENIGSRPTLDEAKELAESDYNAGIGNPQIDKSAATKYESYQTQGEKSGYKEVLITMPNEGGITQKKLNDMALKQYNKPYSELNDAQQSNTRQYVLESEGKGKQDKFRSTHFNEPNILVHLRMNIRTDADGKRVLFLEEVQSDWGQKGKKEGFMVGDKNELNKLDKEIEEYYAINSGAGYVLELKKKYNEDNPIKLEKLITEDEKKKWGEVTNRRLSYSDLIEKDKKFSDLVKRANKIRESLDKSPSAPFITDTNAWTKLGLKYALQHAVKEGAKKLVWTTGEQQNERYDLSKQVDEIRAYKNADGTTSLVGTKGSQDVFFQDNLKDNQLEQYIGKELADKIIKGEGEDISTKVAKELGRKDLRFSGQDLKVGGKGMIGFYGSPEQGKEGIVGNVAKSLIKELTGKDGNIMETKLTSAKWGKEDGRNILKDADGKYIGDYSKLRDGRIRAVNMFGEEKYTATEKEAKSFIDNSTNFQKSTQHSIEITPELKSAVEEGMPLFQKQGGEIKGAANVNGKETFLGKKSDISTLIHEQGHHLYDAIKTLSNEGNEKAKQVVSDHNNFASSNEGKDFWDRSKHAGEDWAKGEFDSNNETLKHELFARAAEKYFIDGKKAGFSDKMIAAFDRFKDLLRNIYKSLINSPEKINLSPELERLFNSIYGEKAVEDLLGKPKEKTADQLLEERKKQGGIKSSWESNIEALVDKEKGLAAVISRISDRIKPYRDAYMKRKGITMEYYSKLSEEEKRKIDADWRSSKEYQQLDEEKSREVTIDQLIEEANKEGKMPNVMMLMGRDGIIEQIAHDAQNLNADGTPSDVGNKEEKYQSQVVKFGKELVDAAIKEYNEKQTPKSIIKKASENRMVYLKTPFIRETSLKPDFIEGEYKLIKEYPNHYLISDKNGNQIKLSKDRFSDSEKYRGENIPTSENPKIKQNDNTNIKGALPSGEPQGEAIIKQEPIKETGNKEAESSGVVQEAQQKKLTPREKAKDRKEAREQRQAKFEDDVDKAISNIKDMFTAKGLGDAKRSGSGVDLETVLNVASKIIKEAYRKGEDISEAIKQAIEHVKNAFGDNWKDEYEKPLIDEFNKIKEVVKGKIIGISKSKIFEQYGQKFEKARLKWDDLSKKTLSSLAESAKNNNRTIEEEAESQVNQMSRDIRNNTLSVSEHKIIVATVNLMDLDTKLDDISNTKTNTSEERQDLALMADELTSKRNETLKVIDQLGSKSGRNLGLFAGMFSKNDDGGVSIARVKMEGITGVRIPESMDELNKMRDDKKISDYDYKKALPYVKKLEEQAKEHEKELKEYKDKEKQNDEAAIQDKIKEAYEQGKKEGSIGNIATVRKARASKIKEAAKKLREEGGITLQMRADVPIKVRENVAKAMENIADEINKDVTANEEKIIKNAVDKFKGDEDTEEFKNLLKDEINKASIPTLENTTSKISELSELNADTHITKEMVDNGLIKDIVNHFIYDEVPYDKVMDKAFEEIKKVLPDVTKNELNQAYLEKGNFKKETKQKILSDKKQVEQGVKRVANLENDIEGLEKGEEFNKESDTNKKKVIKSDFEKQLEEKKKAAIKDKLDAKKELEKTTNKEKRDKLKERIENADKEISYVKRTGEAFKRATKNPKKASEEWKSKKAELEKAYIEAGVKRESGDKESREAKKQVIGNLSDAIDNYQTKLNQDAAQKINDGSHTTEDKVALNNIHNELNVLKSGLEDNGQDLKWTIDKAHEHLVNIEKALDNKDPMKPEIQKIITDFRNDWQKTADELSRKRLESQYQREINEANRKINSKIYTEIPTNRYDIKSDENLSMLERQKRQRQGVLNSLTKIATEGEKSTWQKLIDWRRSFITGGIQTLGRVNIAGVSKLFVDPMITQATDKISTRLLGYKGEEISSKEALSGFKGLYEFKNNEEAAKYMAKTSLDYQNATEKLINAHAELNKLKEGTDAYSKYQNEVYNPLKADYLKKELEYARSQIYTEINANIAIDAKEIMVHGTTQFDENMGGKFGTNVENLKGADKALYYLNSINRLHSVAKNPSARRALVESYNHNLLEFQKQGIPLDYSTRMRALNMAYVEFNAGKYNQETQLSQTTNRLKGIGDKPSSNTIEKLGGYYLKVALPVMKIGVNILKRGVDMSTLGAEGISRHFMEVKKAMKLNEAQGKEFDKWVDKYKEAVKSIPAKDRIYINKVLSNGIAGGLLIATSIALCMNDKMHYGGVYSQGAKKQKYIDENGKEQELEFGQWEIDGHVFGKFMSAVINHIPEFIPMGLTANTFNVMKAENIERAKGKDVNMIGKVLLSDMNQVGHALPYSNVLHPQQLASTLLSVPILKDIASALQNNFDRDKNGNLIERENKTFGEKVKTQAGLNILNPIKSDGVFDKYDKAVKMLIDNGIELPKVGTKLEHKIPVDATHKELGKENGKPYSVMSDEEFNKYNSIKFNIIKEGLDIIRAAKEENDTITQDIIEESLSHLESKADGIAKEKTLGVPPEKTNEQLEKESIRKAASKELNSIIDDHLYSKYPK